MFDIGFWELAVIGVITLLVVGPERLPRIARTAGLWLGKARYFITSVKADIDREIRADELKRIMQEQARSAGVHEIIEETKSTMEQTRAELESTRADLDQARSELESLEDSTPAEPVAGPAEKNEERDAK